MAVQQNKKSPSKRGMHRSHNAARRARHRDRADHRRDAPAPPHQPTGFYRGRKVLKTKADA